MSAPSLVVIDFATRRRSVRPLATIAPLPDPLFQQIARLLKEWPEAIPWLEKFLDALWKQHRLKQGTKGGV